MLKINKRQSRMQSFIARQSIEEGSVRQAVLFTAPKRELNRPSLIYDVVDLSSLGRSHFNERDLSRTCFDYYRFVSYRSGPNARTPL